MTMIDWQAVWTQLSDGQHVVLCGVGPIPQPDLRRIKLSWVDCELHPEAGGTMAAARRRIDRDLGVNPWVDSAAQQLRSSLRRHLLGEAAEDIDAARDEQAFRRAAPAGSGPRRALLLSGVDQADRVSIERLARLFTGDHPPSWPLLIRFDAIAPTGAAGDLLEHLERALPAESFFRGSEPAAATGVGAAASDTLSGLSTEALRVLRAAATIGDRFELETVAELLEIDDLTVLDAIQEASDHGLRLEDRGQGVFRFEPRTASILREATLPALATAWHRRLAELFGGLPAPVDVPSDASSKVESRANGAAPKPRSDTIDCPATLRDGCAPLAGSDAARAPEEGRDPTWWQRLEDGVTAAQPGARGFAGTAPPSAEEGDDAARAARHAEAASLYGSAARRYLAAAMAALSGGRYAAALDAADRALAAAEGGPDPNRQWLEASAWLVIGRCRWLTGGNEPASLEDALDALERARGRAATGHHPELQAEIASMIANVCYDIGTPTALERALGEITRGSELWLDAGHPLDAARLLNDEAAIWVKRGNPVRANQLLLRSRDVFGKIVHVHPVARLELLETEHLLARLMLHSAAQPGRDEEVARLGIEHALMAETGYRELNSQRELGRVWETLGRLELRLGRLDKATQWLEQALRLQRELGDALGSARSSAALSEVFSAAHDYPRALARLAESVALNSEKGAAAGLQHNLAALRQLEATLPGALVDQAGALGRRIVRASSDNG
jgi:tetratricopeptide (TPR) repeat protein